MKSLFAVVLLIAIGGGVAVGAPGGATVAASGKQVTACVVKAGGSKGDVRIVDAKGDCASGEKALVWNRRGPRGLQGPAGPAGAKGAAGADGEDGLPGTNGTNGTPGAAGGDGAAGTNGTNGIDGTNGTNGTNGATGPAGPTASAYAWVQKNGLVDLTSAGAQQIVSLTSDSPGGGQGGRSGAITTTFASRLQVAGTVLVNATSAGGAQYACLLEYTPTSVVSWQTVAGSANSVFAGEGLQGPMPLIGSVDLPAGTYNVRISCERLFTSTARVDAATIQVTAVGTG